MIRYIISAFVCFLASAGLYAQPTAENDKNYIEKRTMLTPNGKYITSIQYYDDLGRPTKSVSNGIGDNANNTLYTLKEYDCFSRESVSWLPSPNNSFFGERKSITTYDALSRPVFTTTPGNDMGGRGKAIAYTTNTSSNPVKHYFATSSGISQDNTYAESSLIGEKTTDEDGHTIEVFKDLRGNVILERRASNNDTYYVYNDLAQLRYVLSPMYQEEASLEKYAYQYTYDSKGRMATKKLPGCKTAYFSYDTANRMISSKDGNGIIHFYLYDGLGRMVVQGTCKNMLTNDSQIRNYSFSLSSNGVCNTRYNCPSGYNLNNPVLEIANYYDYREDFVDMVAGSLSGYTFPKNKDADPRSSMVGQIQQTSDGEKIYSAFYYNIRGKLTEKREVIGNKYIQTTTQYSFTDKPEFVTTYVKHNGKEYTMTTTYNNSADTDMLLSKTTDYNGREAVIAFTYDALNRMSNASYNGNSNLTTTYQYDDRGWLRKTNGPLFSEELHYMDDTDGGIKYYNGNISTTIIKAGNANTSFRYEYEYDNLNRLVKAWSGEIVRIGVNKNNKYSEEVSYNLNSSPCTLKRKGKMNNGSFGLIDDLAYNYNGNQLKNIHDAAGSLVRANSFDFREGNENESTVEYTFDNNGNMTKDMNKGISKIEYDALNHPVKITFADGSMTSYVYSADGRKLSSSHLLATENLNQGQIHTLDGTIEANTSISPSEEQPVHTNASTADIVSASASQLADAIREKSHLVLSANTTNYLDNFIFENNSLSKILFDEGYITASDSKFHYYLKDHLGSNRVVASETGTVEQITHYYPFGGVIGDLSTNPGTQKYKYNGKEYDTEHGLNTYDYGARQYDGANLLWSQVDPLAEKYYNISPYAYCGNNPVNNIDLHGDSITFKGEQENIDKAIDIYNEGLGGFYTVKADDKGVLSLSPVEGKNQGEMSSSQKATYDSLNKAINGKGMATINVEKGTNVLIGDVSNYTIDIGDISAIGAGSDISSLSVLAHETYEEYLVQTNPKGKTESTIRSAHASASGVERLITGSYLHPWNRNISDGKMEIPVIGTNNETLKTIYINFDISNNVTSVIR